MLNFFFFGISIPGGGPIDYSSSSPNPGGGFIIYYKIL